MTPLDTTDGEPVGFYGLCVAVETLILCGYFLYPQVCLVNDPRPQNPYGKLYSVEFLGNMVGGRSTLYNNQPIQLLKKAAAESIKDGEVRWHKWAQLQAQMCAQLWLLFWFFFLFPPILGRVVRLWRWETFPQQAGH